MNKFEFREEDFLRPFAHLQYKISFFSNRLFDKNATCTILIAF